MTETTKSLVSVLMHESLMCRDEAKREAKAADKLEAFAATLDAATEIDPAVVLQAETAVRFLEAAGAPRYFEHFAKAVGESEFEINDASASGVLLAFVSWAAQITRDREERLNEEAQRQLRQRRRPAWN